MLAESSQESLDSRFSMSKFPILRVCVCRVYKSAAHHYGGQWSFHNIAVLVGSLIMHIHKFKNDNN